MTEDQPRVLKMILKVEWIFFRHTEQGITKVPMGPGEFKVIEKGQRLVFVDAPDTGMNAAYARSWGKEECKEHQIIIIDPEKEKAKRGAEERMRQEQKATEKKELIPEEEKPFQQEGSTPPAAAPKIPEEVKKKMEEEASETKETGLSEKELSKIGKVEEENRD